MKISKFLSSVGKKLKRVPHHSIGHYKEEILIRQGREQFQELLKKGLGIPVALL